MKNVKKTETYFDWSTLFLCQSRSILPKAYKRNVRIIDISFHSRYLKSRIQKQCQHVLSTMKPNTFFRRLFGLTKKEKREEEMQKEKMRSERENRLFDLVEEIEEELQRFEERNKRRKAIDRRKKMELEVEEERKRRKFYDLCQFFERRGYEFFTRTPILKMGDLYPDLDEFVPPTNNRVWQKKMVQMYPSLRW